MQSGLKNLLKNIVSKTGFQVTRLGDNTEFRIEEFQYGAVKPYANYSPWYGDADFQHIYSQMSIFTGVMSCGKLLKRLINSPIQHR